MGTNVDDVVGLTECTTERSRVDWRKGKGMGLPWVAPPSPGVLDVTCMISKDLLGRVPHLGPGTTIISTSHARMLTWQKNLPAMAITAAAVFGSLGYYAFFAGLLVWPHGEEVHLFGRRRLADYGHLGAALAGVNLLGQQATRAGQWEEEQLNASPVKVEVPVEKAGVS
jgi:sorting and assembly machinery component 37